MLTLSNISKSFPGVKALSSVSIEADRNEIHALLGENGAGKSTLIKTVCGVHLPDEGQMWIDGRVHAPATYHHALESGIALVSQEIQIVPEATVAENIMLDKLERFRGLFGIKWRALEEAASEFAEMVGLHVDLSSPAKGMSAAQKQLIQIAKALSRNASILFLDEPTSSITETEAGILFDLLRDLRTKGVLVVIVSHKLEEVFAICDRIHVLRDGQYVGSVRTEDTNEREVVKMMIGRSTRDVDLGVLDPSTEPPALEVRNVSRTGMANDVSLSVQHGEILGLYGLVGAGRTELARLIIAESPMDSGTVLVNGQPVEIRSVQEAQRKYKIGYVTENRKEQGLFLDFDVRTNLAVASWEAMRSGPMNTIDLNREKADAQSIIDQLSIKITDQSQTVGRLSGGNQQKVSIGRWLLADMDIIIFDEPTVGIDIGAKEYIHDLIWALAKEQNKAIILISSDMPEMIKLARRIMVFRDQRVVGEINDINVEGAAEYATLSHRIGEYLA